MNYLQPLADELGVTAEWEEHHGSFWLKPESVDVREMAQWMNAHDARLITIAAMELPDGGGIRMDYHWDVNGTLATVATTADNRTAATISDLCQAADWIEREIREYFAIEFTGRECAPLFLRPGTQPGINLHKEDE